MRVINESCDGRTTQYDSGELNGYQAAKKIFEMAKPIDLVLVALGTNDLKKKYGPPRPSEIIEGIHRIRKIIKAKQPGATFFLVAPPPMGVEVVDSELNGAQSDLAAVVAGYRRYAVSNDIPMIDLYSVIDKKIDLEKDAVHLNQKGRKKVANLVWNDLSRFLNQEKRK